jgi:hypothetical protein
MQLIGFNTEEKSKKILNDDGIKRTFTTFTMKGNVYVNGLADNIINLND